MKKDKGNISFKKILSKITSNNSEQDYEPRYKKILSIIRQTRRIKDRKSVV